jgi:hypothetical protein
MDTSIIDKATTFDTNGLNKKEVDNAVGCLKEFRRKFQFAENPASIDTLKPDDVFNETSGEVGEFFHYLEYYFRPLGHPAGRDQSVYRNVRTQIEDFKGLLKATVDKKKTIAQKVDVNWAKIKGLGEDKQLPKKIIFCFNYESGKVLPIFSTNHLKHFIGKIADKPSQPAKYYTPGEEYESLTSELLKAKANLPVTSSWEITYFTRFLYENYPPPDREKAVPDRFGTRKTANVVTREMLEQGEFMHLLGELQKMGKITGQQFRENRELWVNQPQERTGLTKRLKALLN